MNTAIIICLVIAVLLAAAGWYTGRTATTDGEFTYVIPWVFALASFALALALFLVKLVVKVWN
jgi:uncharacterized Tic20 family protein